MPNLCHLLKNRYRHDGFTRHKLELRKHQKNAVFRFFQELSSLLAHDVGTGKSYTMIASAIEGKRLKVHNKPMIVLPNHVAPQIAAEARRLYPNANIKLIQAVSRKDKNRALASLKNNSHDIIITTYTAFTNMNVAPSAFKNYINMEVEHLKNIYYQLEKSGETSKRELNSITNRIEKAEERATNYAKSVANDKQNVFFEDLGIDTLMFDEAHYLKNLPIFTAQRNVRGIGSADSQRAIDAFMKISQMRDLPNNRVLFATGTPITNFISDIFTMQRFLGSKDLEAKGIDVFDEWCKMFAGASSEFEMKATGEYKLTSRLRDFSNLPELKAMYYKFADLVTKEDMQKAILEEGGKIIEPKVRRIPVVLKRNQAQIDFMESVKKRAKVLQENPQAAMEKGGDNMLKIISDSNKASIDMRLIDSSYKRDENGKISAAANNILEVYNDFNEHKGTQLVFLDTSVPKKPIKPETLEKWQKELERLDSVIQNQSHNLSDNQLEKLRDKASDLESKIARGSDGFSAYNDLKDLLIEKGIKENEVAFVHDFEGIKKETLSQKINSGEIRVLIGSTSKMGAGSNFQERLAAIHHLDLDWTPANMEQREGRIIRQGNRLMDLVPDFEARIYTYVTEQMSDSLMLQTLEQKTKIIKQIQDPNLKTRVIEDISEDNLHGRLKAMTSPNIMYANPKHLGAGILSGSAAGIETDENGNIVGFNPQNFVLGLIGGSVASKAVSKLYNNESTQRYATLAIKSIQQDYKSLSENNPAMFAKIMQKFNPRDFLKGKKEINSLSNEIFNKELAKAIESALQNGKVETMPQAEFRNKEEFAKMFDSISGKYGIIETPYKEVKADIKSAWKHFTYNTHNTDRENIKGGFFKTFKDPLFIVEQAREGQSSPSVYFYKPFYDNDKKLMNLFEIEIDSVGNIDFKTYYFDKKENRLKEMLMSDKIKIVYMQENP